MWEDTNAGNKIKPVMLIHERLKKSKPLQEERLAWIK